MLATLEVSGMRVEWTSSYTDTQVEWQ